MFIFLDTETTGTGRDDRLCQVAFKTEDGLVINELFNPGRPISYEAMSVHHITNQMVKDKPVFKESDAYQKLKELLDDDNNVIVAHNAKFDIEMLNREKINLSKVICTLKLARHLDKNGVIPQYNLQYLRYYLELNIDATPHDALGDILVLEGLFKRIYTKFKESATYDPVIEMIRISDSPVLIKRMPFGKHKGMLINEIPPDYLEWLRGTDLDEDLAFTVRYHLGLS
jgi:DNA polymerase III epsilon subunit-like protein